MLAMTVAAAYLLGSSPAFTQTRDPAASEAVFQEGRRLMKEGKFGPACDKFEESYRLDPAVGTLVNLADCEEQTGRTASAWQHWKQAVDQLPAGDRRRYPATLRVAALEKSLAHLTIELAPNAPPDVLITRNGVTLGLPSLGVPLPVNPGKHVIVVSAPGRESAEFEVMVGAAEQRNVSVAPGAVLRGEQPTLSSKPKPRRVTERHAHVQRAAEPQSSVSAGTWVLLGTGAAGIGLGALFAVRAHSARQDAEALCPSEAGRRRCWADARDALDRDERNSILADVSFAVGALATGAGLYLLLTSKPESTSQRAMIVPTRDGGEVQIHGSF
jgi:hypothetical protein